MATPKQTKPAQTPPSPNGGTANAAPTPGVSALASAVQQRSAEAAARNAAAEKDIFKYKADLTKGAPQAKGIVNILKAAGSNGMTRSELVTAMKGVIVTKQPEGRILSYYQKDLETVGAVEIVKAPGSVATGTGAAAKKTTSMSTTEAPAVPTPSGPAPTPIAS